MKTFRRFLILAFLYVGITVPLRAETLTSLNVSTPLAVSGSFGFLFGDTTQGATPSIEAGIGGYKFLAGVHNLNSSVPTSIRVSYMHTWFEPVDLDENQTYLGIEFQAGLGPIIGTVGGYRRIDGDDDAWTASFGLGIRF